MPIKIQQYDSPQVETQISSGAVAHQANPNTFGRDVLTGVQSFAQSIEQMQKQIAAAEAEEAITAFEREKNNVFFNPDTGYFNTQGRDAYDQADGVSKKLEEMKRSYSSNLKSDLARRAFDKVASQHVTRANQDILVHASKNVKAWEAKTINSQIENTLENAALYWNDKERLDVQRELGRQSVIDAAKIEGVDAAVTNERLQTFESSFATSMIEAATSSSSAEGKATLDQLKDKLEGPDLVKMQNMIATKIKTEKTKADSQMAVLSAGNLVQKYGDTSNARSSILEEVNKIADPDLREQTMKESMFQLEAKMKADSEERGVIFEAGENHIISGGSVEQFKAENPEAWEKLTPKMKRVLSSGEAIISDSSLLADLLLLPASELAKVDPNEYKDKLDKSDRAKLVTAVKSASTGGTEHQVGRTRTAETSAAVEQLFGKSTSWSNDKKKQVNQFYALVDSEHEFRKSQKGAELTSSEFTAMLADMTRTTVRHGIIDLPFFFGLGNDDVTIKDIPSEYIPELTKYLHDNKIPANAENLMRAYLQATGEY